MATDDPTFAAAMSSFQTAATPATLDPVAAALAASSATESYATSLPASPTDGLTAVLVDSTTAPTYQWRFRYNGSSVNSDKWEFIGGAPGYAEITTLEATSSTSYVDLATVGPTFVVSRAGIYLVEIRARHISDSGGAIMYTALRVNAAASADANAAITAVNSAGYAEPANRIIKKTLAAADSLTFQYKVAGAAGSPSFEYRSMAITPVRVS